MKTLVIVENATQTNWACRRNHLVLPVTLEAQIRLSELGINHSYYVDLNPGKTTSVKYISAGERFYKTINFKDKDFNLSCRMHWLVFIPELLRSFHVVRNVIRIHHPGEIVIFPKDEKLNIVNDNRSLEAFTIRSLKNTNLLRNIKITEVDNMSADPAKKIFISNLLLYIKNLTAHPLDLFYIFRAIIFPLTGSMHTTTLLLQMQRHILIESLPLLKQLRKMKINFLVIADSLLLRQKITLAKNNISYTDYDAIGASVDKKAAVSISSAGSKYLNSNDYARLLKTMSLTHLEPAITKQFSALVDNFSCDYLLSISKAKHSLVRTKPKAVILAGNSGKRGLGFALAARKLQIPSVVIQHGVDIAPVQSTAVFDTMLVWGEGFRKWYAREMGIAKKSFFPGGWYFTDNIIAKAKAARQAPIETSRSPIIFLPLCYYQIDNYKIFYMLRDVVRIFLQNPQYRLVIRPHPGQLAVSQLEYCLNPDRHKNISWDLGKDIDVQIKSSDIILTTGTTVGLRAMLWGKPLLHLMTMGVVDKVDYTKYGACVNVYRESQLVSLIKRYTTDRKAILEMRSAQEKFLQTYLADAKHASAPRIVEYILNTYVHNH